MALSDIVNTIFREFKRYTGDGLPGEPTGAPLPIGDPQSGTYSPKKSEIRAAFLDILQGLEDIGDQAEAILADLMSRYLGAYADDAAATAAVGGTPTEGQMYFNTTDGKFRVFHGGGWQDQSTGLSDGEVTEVKVTTSPEDALRVTISNLAYVKWADRSDDPDAASANLAAVNLAASEKKFVETGEGDIWIDGPIQLPTTCALRGPGAELVKIKLASASSDAIQIAAGAFHSQVIGLRVTRTVQATAGAGIRFMGASQMCTIDDNVIDRHYIGILARGTGYGFIRRNYVYFSVAQGFYFIALHVPGLQYIVQENLSESNGGDGYYATTDVSAGYASVTMGTWEQNRSFGTSGWGANFEGSSGARLHGVRIEGGFFGEDALGEIRLSTHGGLHRLHSVYAEGAGQQINGPLSSPPTYIGHGVLITANNRDVAISDPKISGNSNDGIRIDMTDQLSTCSIIGGHNRYNGIGTGGGVGIRVEDARLATIDAVTFGTDTFANIDGNIVFGSNSDQRQVSNCLPQSVNRIQRARVIYDFPSVPANSTISADVAVPGLALGDILSVSSNAPEPGLTYSAAVSAAGVATISARNSTGAAINPGNASFRFLIDKA